MKKYIDKSFQLCYNAFTNSFVSRYNFIDALLCQPTFWVQRLVFTYRHEHTFFSEQILFACYCVSVIRVCSYKSFLFVISPTSIHKKLLEVKHETQTKSFKGGVQHWVTTILIAGIILEITFLYQKQYFIWVWMQTKLLCLLFLCTARTGKRIPVIRATLLLVRLVKWASTLCENISKACNEKVSSAPNQQRWQHAMVILTMKAFSIPFFLSNLW